MPSVPVFLNLDTEKTPLLRGSGTKRTRTVSSPDLLSFNSPVPPLFPKGQPPRERRVSVSSANLTTIHETDENEDFDSSTAIINTPRSGTFPPWNYYSLGSYHGRMRGRKRTAILWISFALCAVFLSVFMVSMPVYFAAGMRSGSDAYVAMVAGAIWFPIGYFVLLVVSKIFIRNVPLTPRVSTGSLVGAGILLGICHSGLSMSCLPQRTPPVFQALQLTLMIPVWVLMRAAVNRECSSTKGIAGIFLTLTGIALAMIPELLMATDVIKTDSDVIESWVHPLVLSVSSVIFGLYLGLVEKMSSRLRTDLLTTITWTHAVSLVTLIMMFWVDFLPVVGMLSNKNEFIDNLTRGFDCFYNGDRACADLSIKGAIFIGSYLLGTYFLLLLIRATQGGSSLAYMAIALVVSTSTVCWMLFEESPYSHFEFDPDIDAFTLLVVGGVIMFVLAMVLFTMASAESPVQRPLTPNNNRLIHFRFDSVFLKGGKHDVGTLGKGETAKKTKATAEEEASPSLPRVKSSPAMLTF